MHMRQKKKQKTQQNENTKCVNNNCVKMHFTNKQIREEAQKSKSPLSLEK